MDALTVSEFVAAVDGALGELGDFVVEGEVSGFQIKDDKWVLFDLKDEQSVVRCFMTAWQLKAAIEDGMQVRARGYGTLKKWGQFSFNLRDVQPTGEGSLKRAFELLQKKLAEEGLFAEERKRALPRFPEHVALITSRDAAAYSDFIKVLQGRQGGLTVSFVHTQVQGDDAPRQIVEALDVANTELQDLDAIVLVRGGGSLEDLQSFNDERVVRAVAASRAPIVVGVGHERDVTLADMAADVRASTPSNAAEMLVSTREELLASVVRMREQLSRAVHEQLKQSDTLIRQLVLMMRGEVRTMTQGLQQLTRVLQSLSPTNVLARGYSISRSERGRVVKRAEDVAVGDVLVTQLQAGSLTSSITAQDEK